MTVVHHDHSIDVVAVACQIALEEKVGFLWCMLTVSFSLPATVFLLVCL